MNSDFFLKMLGNKEQVVQQILRDIDQSQVISKELTTMINTDEIDINHSIKSLAKSQRRLSSSVFRLGIIALVYTQSDSFSSDNAHLLAKMGRGLEAVRAYAKSKFGFQEKETE